MDYAAARRSMVDGQLRPNRVTEPRLLEAMRTLPREAFLPPALRSRAYVDEDVALPGTDGPRALMEPMVVARLIQLAAVRPDDRALVVCAGTGYAAAVLAHMGARVVALEEDAGLRALAESALAACGLPPGAVRLESGRPTQGFPAAAPYDAILIEGEVPEVPQAIGAQLAEGGRLVAVVGGGSRSGHAVLGRRIGGAVTVTPAFDCATFALPAFASAPGFVF
jgi:protein-L-isoaspartate(D-aspartate) O-methyltransferase